MKLVKDKSILDLLARLGIKARGWLVMDHWDADLCAIGLGAQKEPRRLVYVSTFRQKADRYYYECEIPCGPELADYSVVEEAENVDFETLLSVLERHLDHRRAQCDS